MDYVLSNKCKPKPLSGSKNEKKFFKMCRSWKSSIIPVKEKIQSFKSIITKSMRLIFF